MQTGLAGEPTVLQRAFQLSPPAVCQRVVGKSTHLPMAAEWNDCVEAARVAGFGSLSLVDACVLRMAEIRERHAVLTLDSEFSVYRKRGRVPLALIYPASTSS
jgi:hypothetical protein